MTKEQWKEYNDWLKEVIIDGYKSVYLEETEEDKLEAKKVKDRVRAELRIGIRKIKLEEIDIIIHKIKELKIKINLKRDEYGTIAQEVANACQGNIVRWELLLKEADSEWIHVHFLKNIEETKQGYFGGELEHYQNWLKHLCIEFKIWESDEYES